LSARSSKGDNDGADSAREPLSDKKKPKGKKEEKSEKAKKEATETKKKKTLKDILADNKKADMRVVGSSDESDGFENPQEANATKVTGRTYKTNNERIKAEQMDEVDKEAKEADEDTQGKKSKKKAVKEEEKTTFDGFMVKVRTACCSERAMRITNLIACFILFMSGLIRMAYL
jgi:hypothetical protein